MADGKLKATFVSKANKPGYYGDGRGLYLQVGPTGTKSWVFRYRLNNHLSRSGRPLSREMGLGSFEDFSLAEARERARAQRQLLADGVDPIEAKRARRAATAEAAGKLVTFREAAEAYMGRPKKPWRNAKHRSQWRATLETYAFPILGDISVAAIDEPLVLKALEPIWTTKTETASRLRGRIETILDAAKVRRQRSGENPARWAGNLEHLLGKPRDLKRAKSHSAMPYDAVPGFMRALIQREGMSARALEWTILTAARTGETIGATWVEIDRATKVWTIPAGRMKAGREHRVPLSDQALAVLERLEADGNGGEFVFPGGKPGAPLSNMAMLELLRGMDGNGATTHGFRSAFRTWAAEETDSPREIAEAALAHVIANKTEAAYQRGELLEKRRKLMEAWAQFCCGPAAPAAVRHGQRGV